MPIPAENEKFTYTDYLKWPEEEEERWELIYGEAWDMSPAPTRKHQQILGKLFYQIEDYLKEEDCKVYIAPFDVRLPENEEDKETDTVIQPDLLVVCDKSKLDDAGCKGAPDWIIEILSPSTAVKDLNTKYQLYQARGVKEYWIVDPSNNYLTVYLLDISGKYFRSGVYSADSKVVSAIFPELIIDLSPVFSD